MSEQLLWAELNALRSRIELLENDAARMPIHANPGRYFRIQSGGKSLDGLGPEVVCVKCSGEGKVVGDLAWGFADTVSTCPVCHGAGKYREQLTAQQLADLKDDPGRRAQAAAAKEKP
jgi:hypothetical protein